MTILDTHVWIWWTSDPRRLSRNARRTVESARRLSISAISCWEVATLAARGGIRLDRGPLEWMEQSIAERGIELLPITPAVAVRAAQLGEGFLGDPADRLVMATALAHAGVLVTKDERMHEAGLAKIVW